MDMGRGDAGWLLIRNLIRDIILRRRRHLIIKVVMVISEGEWISMIGIELSNWGFNGCIWLGYFHFCVVWVFVFWGDGFG